MTQTNAPGPADTGTPRTPVVLSWSGGKDSALALQTLRADPTVAVVGLLTSVTDEYDRISIHGVRRALLEAQAEQLGLPLFIITLPPQSTNETYERAFLSGVSAMRARLPEVRCIAFGDLYLAEVRAYRDRLLRRSGLDPLFPLWGEDTAALARRFIADGFVAHIVCADTTQIDGAFAGRAFDAALLADLPPSADPCGENGEYHTFVSAGPGFRTPIDVSVGECVLREARFMYCDLQPS